MLLLIILRAFKVRKQLWYSWDQVASKDSMWGPQPFSFLSLGCLSRQPNSFFLSSILFELKFFYFTCLGILKLRDFISIWYRSMARIVLGFLRYKKIIYTNCNGWSTQIWILYEIMTKVAYFCNCFLLLRWLSISHWLEDFYSGYSQSLVSEFLFLSLFCMWIVECKFI